MRLFYCLLTCFLPIINLVGALTLELHQLPTHPIDEKDPIRAMDHQIVTVRGFWHPLNASEGILTPQPNLRTCCIGSPKKIYTQIVVKDVGFQFPPNKIATLEGEFRIKPEYDDQNNLTQVYVLLNPILK